MTHKLLTLEELSEDLGIKKSKLEQLVRDKVIFAYRIGGELLRFRKEQIDAQRKEIFDRCEPSDRIDPESKKAASSETADIRSVSQEKSESSLEEKIRDFLYFYDFYIISGFIVLVLLVYIFKS